MDQSDWKAVALSMLIGASAAPVVCWVVIYVFGR